MSIKTLTSAVVLGLGLAGSFSAFAGSTTELRVVGKIIPTACEPTLSSNTVDFGKISSSDLNQDTITALSKQTVTFQVECLGPTKFAVRGIDNAAGSALTESNYTFGLGKSDKDEKIGEYTLQFQNTGMTGDGEPVIGLISTNKTGWVPDFTIGVGGGGGPRIHQGTTLLGFADAGETTPKDIKMFQGALDVYAVIAPKKDLDTTDDMKIDGSTTLEVTYL